MTTRILFDTGSQRTYITENLRKLLKLKTIRTENIIINTFGKLHEPKLETLDVVQAKVKHRFTNEYTFIEALCYPLLCKPLRNQEISLAKRSYENLSSLDLADFKEDNSELKIRVLVGVDYYYSFFTGKLIRNVHGPVANSSVFGWILSGRFPCLGKGASCLSIETHSMWSSLQQKPDENELLRKQLQKFWDVEAIASPDENIVCKFENDIKHNGVRYVTKLPFKLDHNLLPDNYEICKNRLINL